MVDLTVFDEDWGAEGKQWTGAQVQQFIKDHFKSLYQMIEALPTPSEPQEPTEPGVSCDCASFKQDFKKLQDKVTAFLGEDEAPKEGLSLDSISSDLKKLQEKFKAFFGDKEQPDEGSSFEAIAEVLQKLKEANVSEIVSSLTESNKVESSTSIPTNKRLVVVTLSGSDSFTLANKLKDGEEIHVVIKNSSEENIVVTLPNDGGYSCLVDTALNVTGNGIAEVNVISDGETMYIRAI